MLLHGYLYDKKEKMLRFPVSARQLRISMSLEAVNSCIAVNRQLIFDKVHAAWLRS